MVCAVGDSRGSPLLPTGRRARRCRAYAQLPEWRSAAQGANRRRRGHRLRCGLGWRRAEVLPGRRGRVLDMVVFSQTASVSSMGSPTCTRCCRPRSGAAGSIGTASPSPAGSRASATPAARVSAPTPTGSPWPIWVCGPPSASPITTTSPTTGARTCASNRAWRPRWGRATRAAPAGAGPPAGCGGGVGGPRADPAPPGVRGHVCARPRSSVSSSTTSSPRSASSRGAGRLGTAARSGALRPPHPQPHPRWAHHNRIGA